MSITPQIQKVIEKLEWMKEKKIWPNGERYLWTDSFGVVNLLSLYKHLGDKKYLDEAKQVVDNVYSVLGRKKGLRIGQQPDRDGQYFHYLAKWMFALNELGKIEPQYHQMAVDLVRQVHPHFIIPKVGVYWKMREDLSGVYPGYGLGGLDFYQGYVTYRLIDEKALSSEIGDMHDLVQMNYKKFSCTQDLGLGDTLYYCHFFPDEHWAQTVKERCVYMLDKMWRKEGYFARDAVYQPKGILAFGNFGVSLGLQSQKLWPERVNKLNQFFEGYKSGDEYDMAAITHVMQCTSYFPGLFLKDFDAKPYESL